MFRLWVAYGLWLTGGLLGWHLAYLGYNLQAMGYAMTSGGFGVSWLMDVWYLPQWVAAANGGRDFVLQQAAKQTVMSHPKVRWWGMFLQMNLGHFVGLVGSSLLPPGLPANYYKCALAVSTGCGVYLGGIMTLSTEATASLTTTILAGTAVQEAFRMLIRVYPHKFSAASHDESKMFGPAHLLGLLAGIAAFNLTRQWKRRLDTTIDVKDVDDVEAALKPTPKRPSRSSGLTLHLVLLLLWSSACGIGSWHYGHINWHNPQTGIKEHYTVQQLVENVRQSPVWNELDAARAALYKEYQRDGFGPVWEHVQVLMDPDGTRRARKELGVSPDATQSQIKAAHRKLVLRYHPDKLSAEQLADPKRVDDARDRFVRIQKSYDTLKERFKKDQPKEEL